MESKNYFRGDGNGGYNIGKHTSISIALVLIILGAAIPTAVAYTRLEAKVTSIENMITVQNPIQKQKVYALEKRQHTNELTIATYNEQITSIKEDISDIKHNLEKINDNLQK